jgi:hypothetical protein
MPNIGKYEIESRIGHGGMGDVYRAYDPTLRRKVAIKVLKVEGDTESLNRFRLEATSAGNLNHPNIVTIHDYGDFNGEPYIVMEYLEGDDLQRTIDSGKKFELVEITDIMSQVADALECAHQAGVIHRDVKPANIMLLSRGGVKLMDFGIARLAGGNTQQTKAGHLIGTVLYMSPEQFHNLELDRRVDIWAFGVIYYQLLAGKHPFQVPDQIVTMYNIANKAAPPICSVNQEVPEALGQIVDRCLAKDRDQRYSSMEDLRFDVMPVLQDLSRQQAARMIGEAQKMVDSEEWDSAQAIVKRVLELDPAHRAAISLRRTIVDALRKREAAPRLTTLVATAERHAAAKEYPRAIEALETAAKIDPTAEDVRKRLADIREIMERERRAVELLLAARHDLATEHFTGAYQNAAEALRFDPGRTEAKQLLASVKEEMEKRERQKRIRESLDQARHLMSSASHEEAVLVLRELNASHPGTLEVAQMLREAESLRDLEQRGKLLNESMAAVKELLRLQRFPEAVQRLEALSGDFPGEDEVIQMLHYSREEWKVRQRIDALERAKANIAQLQHEARFDEAIRLVNRSQIEFPGETDLLRLAQALTTAKAQADRRSALERVIAEAQGKKQSGDISAAIKLADFALQQHGPDERLLSVREQLERDWQISQRNQSLRKALQEGRQFAERKEWEKAVAYFQDVVRQHPDENEPRRLLSDAENSLATERKARVERDTLRKAGEWEAQNHRDSALAEVEAGLSSCPDSTALQEAKIRLAREIAEARKTHERELKLYEARRKADEDQRRRAQELEEKAREQGRQRAAKVEDTLANAYLAISQGDLSKAAKLVAEARKADPSHPGLPRAQSDVDSAQQMAMQQIAVEQPLPKESKPLPLKAIAIGGGAALLATVAVYFMLHKTPAAPLQVSPESAGLLFIEGGAPPAPVTLALTGTGPFQLKSSDPWISLAPESGNLPATVVLTGKSAGLAPGSYQGSIDISAGQSAKRIAVNLTVSGAKPPIVDVPIKPPDPTKPVAPAEFSLSPEALTVAYRAGAPEPAARSIFVQGKGRFQVTVKNPEWASIKPVAGSMPGTISVAIHPAQLAPGSYATQISVTAADNPAVKKLAIIRLTVTAAAEVPKAPVVTPPSPEPVKCSSDGYLRRRIGDLVWNGTMPPNGKVVIVPGAVQSGGGSLVGNDIPTTACFDVSNLPAGLRAATSGSMLVLTNGSGSPISTITIHWTVK